MCLNGISVVLEGMKMKLYKSWKILSTGEKPRWVIVDEDDNGRIINRNPSKEELKGLEEEYYKRNVKKKYTNEELLNSLKRFYNKNGRRPIQINFDNNSEYPGSNIYHTRFGSWNNALKMVGLDTKPKLDRRNTICCICKSDKTLLRPNGNPFWTRHRDKYGIWNGRSYECYKCHYGIGISKKFREFKGLRKGTLILTEDVTYVPIENIKTGDMIIGFVQDYYYLKFTPSRVLNILERKDLIYKIRTNHGDVYSAKGHTWLSYGIRWRDTYNFIPGQFLRNVSTPIRLPSETEDYKIGYIAGSYEGDGYISLGRRTIPDQAKLVGDYEMMDQVLKYSDELGIGLYESPFNGGKFALDTCITSVDQSVVAYIRDIIDQDSNDEYKRGYLAGIYDAEGGWSTSIRIYNTNEKILDRIARYLHYFGFETELDTYDNMTAIRIVGGLEEYIKFLTLVNPKAENKKIAIFDYHFKIKERSIILDIIQKDIDDIFNLETTTGNFIADGFITHDMTDFRDN